MPTKSSKSNTVNVNGKPVDYETLVRQVYERVWQLWQEDLRRSRERGGKVRRR